MHTLLYELAHSHCPCKSMAGNVRIWYECAGKMKSWYVEGNKSTVWQPSDQSGHTFSFEN